MIPNNIKNGGNNKIILVNKIIFVYLGIRSLILYLLFIPLIDFPACVINPVILGTLSLNTFLMVSSTV